MGPVEEFFVDRAANLMWRLQRSESAESGLLYSRLHGLKADHFAREIRSYEDSHRHVRTTHQTAHAKVTKALARAECERDRDEVLLGPVIGGDTEEGDPLLKARSL